MSIRIEQHGDDVLMWIKAVPGAARDQIGGELGQRLKIRVSAPAEGGKANAAICVLLANRLGRKRRDIKLESGQTNQEKIVRICQATVAELRSALDN